MEAQLLVMKVLETSGIPVESTSESYLHNILSQLLDVKAEKRKELVYLKYNYQTILEDFRNGKVSDLGFNM